MNSTKSVLICYPLRFYSSGDENALFEWLQKIKCIKAVQGSGNELHLHIKSQKISYQDIWELIGVFKRYNFEDPEQLTLFINKDNKDLFES